MQAGLQFLIGLINRRSIAWYWLRDGSIAESEGHPVLPDNYLLNIPSTPRACDTPTAFDDSGFLTGSLLVTKSRAHVWMAAEKSDLLAEAIGAPALIARITSL